MKQPFNIAAIFIVFSTCFVSNPISISAQAKDFSKIWDSLHLKLKSGKLNDTGYLKKIDSFVTSSPLVVGDKELKSRLNTYKEIALSNIKFHIYRVNYYDYLSENAYINNLAGVCIYYAEKKEEELKKEKPYINSLTLLRRQYSIYNRIRGGNKFSGTKSYYENLPFFEWLPEGIKKDSVPVSTIRNAFLIILAQANIFAFQADSANATNVRLLANKIFDAVKLKFSKDADLIERITAYYYITCEFEMRSRQNYAAAIPHIMAAKQITNTRLKGKSQSWKIGFKNNVLIHLVDVYLEYKKKDSASTYLDSLIEFESKVASGIRDQYDVLNFTSRLKALQGNYKAAYEASAKSLEVKDSVFAVRTVDINNNMYANTQAEDAREGLIKAERQKQKRNSFIALISILFIAIISALLLQIRLKNKKIQESIAKLKIAGEIQIAELEEQKQLTKQEEKKKFGIELHDLAGSVAILKMKVETVMLNTKDEDIKESLSNLSKDVSGVYAKARNQSHNWFNQQGLDIEPSFQKRVKYLMETGLPEGKYKTQITVDDDSIRDISLKTKIEILYIVQEAVTNILKHAKANEVTIFIYNDLPGLIIQITDDGVGFDINKKKSGIGLTSIKSRVEALKGSLSIQSFIHKGTTIDITIPISENQFA